MTDRQSSIAGSGRGEVSGVIQNVPRCAISSEARPDSQVGGGGENGLSGAQLNAIELMVLGRRDTDVARALGVHRRTVGRWRRFDAAFRSELNRRRHEVWGASIDQLRGLLGTAVGEFHKQLRDRYEGTRFRAARALLSLAGAGKLMPPTGPTDVNRILDEMVLAARGAPVPKGQEPITQEERERVMRDLHSQMRTTECSDAEC